jgi:hypothetical protein
VVLGHPVAVKAQVLGLFGVAHDVAQRLGGRLALGDDGAVEQ